MIKTRTTAFIGIALSAIALVGVGGCGMQGGTTVVKHESGMTPATTEVMQAGTYALYDTYDTTPRITVPLSRGDEIGFRDDNGQTIAVAGDRKVPLTQSGRTYYWKRK